jgi:hypothetical protein
MLDRGHQKTVCHESRQALEVERWREFLRIRDYFAGGPWVSLVKLVDLDCKEVVFASSTLAVCALPYRGQRLCYCVRNATQDLRLNVSLYSLKCAARPKWWVEMQSAPSISL